MDNHMQVEITKILKEAREQGDIKCRATAFSLMKGVLENGQRMSYQIRDLEDIVATFRNLDK